MESLLVKGKLPNLRDLIIPDIACSLIDMDLARADMQVVAWDAGCARLKQIFREEAAEAELAKRENRSPDPMKNAHWTNTIELFGKEKMGQKKYYDLGKKFGHAADYLVSAKALAAQAGMLVSECERGIARWYWLNPEIQKWHARIERQLKEIREVRNAFGYRRFFFGRLEKSLPEAVAWIPQSTVGLVINHALCNISENLPLVQLLLQVHDSLVLQTPTHHLHEQIPLIEEQSLITIPYEEPLVIPVGFKTSEVSWGQVKDYIRRKE